MVILSCKTFTSLPQSMIKLAFRNLFRGGLRNLFTLSGVAVSIALFVSLTSISVSMKKQLDQVVSLCKADIIIQERGAATPLASRLDAGVVRQLEKMQDIRSVSAVTVGSVRLSGKYDTLPYLFVFGISSAHSLLAVADWVGTGIIRGRMFRPDEDGMLLGKLAAKRLQADIGSVLTIGNNEKYTVTGIYWSGQGLLDGSSIIALQKSQVLLKRSGYINMAFVESRDKTAVSRLISYIQEHMPGVTAIPGRSLRGQIRAVTMIDSFINVVSAAAMILGGLLVLNTLLMAVFERTREIGILMAIGWSRIMIMYLIVMEALLLSAAGGVLGYLLAFPVLKLLAMLPTTGPGWIPPNPEASLFFVSVGFAVVIGGIGSLYPAVRATCMKPAVALHYE